MNKPFHLMTPAERTAARIAQNRAIDEKIEEKIGAIKNRKPPARSTGEYVRVQKGQCMAPNPPSQHD